MKAVREISLLTTISGWALRKELRAWRLAKVYAPFESPACVFCLRSLQSNIPFPGESSAKCQPIGGRRHPNRSAGNPLADDLRHLDQGESEWANDTSRNCKAWAMISSSLKLTMSAPCRRLAGLPSRCAIATMARARMD